MRFPATLTIQACEDFLDKLSNEENDFLELPVDTRAFAFGGLASAIQAINTWGRYSEKRILQLRSSSKGDDVIMNELMIRPHKFIASMWAKHIAMTGQLEDDMRRIVYEKAKYAIEKQWSLSSGQKRGGLCWFAFVDHSSKAFDPHFYMKNDGELPTPRSAEQFEAVITNMIKDATHTASRAVQLSDEESESLGRIFYELFLNTHEHGRRGKQRSELLKPGVRVLYINAVNLDEKARKRMSRKQLPLEGYLFNENNHKNKRYIEIGIVDSGLGYSDRWRSDNNSDLKYSISIKEEYELFKQCFKFRQTSTLSQQKGNGLPAVMAKLTKLNGFIRIRSGRLALYRDFIKAPFSKEDSCEFSNWTNPASKLPVELSNVAGVAISIMVPLEGRE